MFGERLKALRKRNGITQDELAAEIGIERSSIGKYEGKTQIMPTDDVKIRIADYFGVSLDYLLGRTDQIEAPSIAPANPLSSEEQDLLRVYRSLNSKGRARLLQYASDISEVPSLQDGAARVSA